MKRKEDNSIPVSGYQFELSTRIRAIEKLFKNREEAASAAGVGRSTIQAWGDGKSNPPFEKLINLANAAGVDVYWLATGRGQMFSGISEPASPQYQAPKPITPWVITRVYDDKASADFVEVKRYDIPQPTARRDYEVSKDLTARLRFPGEWISALGVPPESLAAVNVKGDGMAPTIPDGSLVLIDTLDKSLTNGAVYVLNAGGDALIKRIERLYDGGVVLKSDNAGYVPQRLSPEDMETLNIAGRVRWFCAEV